LSKTDWWWRGKRIEEIKEFKYLGYTLQRNGGQETHVRGKNSKGSDSDGSDLGY